MKAFFQPYPRICSWACLLAFFVPTAASLAIDRKPLVATKATVTTISREDLERLPAGRSLEDVLGLAPGVTVGGEDGNQILFGGGSPFDQKILVDGMPLANPLVRGQYLNLPAHMFEEVQIISGGASAQYGSASGAVINIVTRRGTNEWHGSASLFTTPGFLSANPDEGVEATGPQSYDSMLEPGLSLGGPIIKDKLWFFGDFSMLQKNAMPKFEDMKMPKQNTFTAYSNFTYKPNENNTFSLSHLYGRPSESLDEKASYGQYQYDNSNTYNLLNFNYQRQFANGWQAGWHTNLGHYGLNTEDSYHYSNHSESSSDYLKDKSYCDFETGFDFMSDFYDCFCGPNQFGGGISYQSSKLKKTVEGSHGSTTTETESGSTYIDYTENYQYLYQRYDYSRFSAYVQDTWSISDKLTLNVGVRFDRESLSMPHKPADDEKLPDSDYTANLDRQKVPDINWSVISPRVSLTYDITGDGKNVVKASYARYANGLHYDYFTENHPMGGWGYDRNWTTIDGTVFTESRNDWYSTPQTTVYDKDFNAPILTEFALAFEKALSDDLAISVAGFYKKQNSHLQTVDASRLDIDKLMDDGTLEWLGYDPVHVNTTVNMDLYQDTDPNRQTQQTIVNVPGADSEYFGVQIAAQKQFSEKWQASGSFTWASHQGLISPANYMQYYGYSGYYQNPNAHVNAGGAFEYIAPWQIKLNGTYQMPWGINLGGHMVVSSGSPYTHYYQNWDSPFNAYQLGDGDIYGEPQGDSRLPTFWMLNLGLEKTFKVSDTYTATLVVDWYNVTNNQVPLSANGLISSGSTDEIERILNPGLFQFGVRVSF